MPYTRRQQEKKQVFENLLLKCVTRPDLSGVPLIIKNVAVLLVYSVNLDKQCGHTSKNV